VRQTMRATASNRTPDPSCQPQAAIRPKRLPLDRRQVTTDLDMARDGLAGRGTHSEENRPIPEK